MLQWSVDDDNDQLCQFANALFFGWDRMLYSMAFCEIPISVLTEIFLVSLVLISRHRWLVKVWSAHMEFVVVVVMMLPQCRLALSAAGNLS